MRPRTVSLRGRGYNFDTIMWLFVRLSALFMYLLVLVAVVGALILGARQQMSLPDLMRWAFTPVSSHVLLTNVPDIAMWKSLFWQTVGSLMVLTAGAHGLHGLLNVIEDYFPQAWLRRTLRILTLVLWAVLSAVAIYVIFTA